MEKVTKRFDCDLTPSEYNEVVRALTKGGKTRRAGLLKLIRAKNTTPEVEESADEVLRKTIEAAQKEINEAYQTIADLYINAGAALLTTDREKAIELLAKSFELKVPTISIGNH